MRRRLLALAVLSTTLAAVLAASAGHAIYGETAVANSVDGVLFSKIRAALEGKDWAAAEQLLDRRIVEFPHDADAWALLGYTQRMTGRLAAGLTAYEQALQINPRHVAALSYYGAGLVQAGKRDRALAVLSRIVAICGEECDAATALSEAIAAGSPLAEAAKRAP